MGRYSALIGKRVEARYRTADIHLSAVGTLVSDSGKSIFLEDRFSLGSELLEQIFEEPCGDDIQA